jgi:predicted O-linked N-acetylglucosamine transferase (SPINDLY family)
MFWFDTPIVTLPGDLMRGRHTMAMLRIMELPELIAHDEDDYVRIATELGNSSDFRATMRGRIAERKHRLFDGHATLEAFEHCLTVEVEKMRTRISA